MTKCIYDLSHHNLAEGDNYNYIVVAQNANAIIYKCSDPELIYTQGHDPTHDKAFEGFKAVGLPVAEYHFHDPSSTPVANIACYMKYSKRGFLDALDVEDAEIYSPSVLTKNVVDTLDEGSQRTGRKWWLYSNLDFLNNRLINPFAISALIAGIWLAWPCPSAITFPKPLHYTKDAIGIWQKSWWKACPGINDKTLDYSEWQWSDEKWAALVGIPIIIAPTLEERVSSLEKRVSGLELKVL
jgi:GH25 family lysozyme M1 (1,4-beta-N-acetylmuramidase)